MFFQAHAFAEFPVKSGFENELGLRIAAGKTFTTGGPFGRAWPTFPRPDEDVKLASRPRTVKATRGNAPA